MLKITSDPYIAEPSCKKEALAKKYRIKDGCVNSGKESFSIGYRYDRFPYNCNFTNNLIYHASMSIKFFFELGFMQQ